MNVRCAKDENRLLGSPISKNKPPVVLKEYKETIVPATAELKIYPNPFKEQFSISDSNAAEFEIYDFSGKLVLKGKVINGNVTADKILKGVYVLKIKMKNGSEISKKLIKQ